MSEPFSFLTPPLPERGPECPPTRTLDELVASGEIPSAHRAHVQSCPHCSGYLAALTAEQSAFRNQAAAEHFARGVMARAEVGAARGRPAWLRWPVFAGMGGALAAAAALLLVWVNPAHVSTERGWRDKGARFVVVHLRQGMDSPQVVTPGAHVHAGEALRFFYRSRTAGELAILERDSAGAVSVLFPFGGTASAPWAAGSEDALPHSAVLDDSRGQERLWAVFCPHRFELAPLLARVRTGGDLLELSSCEVDALAFEKDAP